MKGGTLLITGGTGSFGNAVLDRFLNSEISEIRIFSRDEKKQDDMRMAYSNPKLKFFIGDIRDRGSIEEAMNGVDYVFHAAALKQVPSCEFHPMQAVYTNIIGASNVIQEAISAKVKKVVCLSTDKAVYPINAMGISKAMMEKIMVAASRQCIDEKTVVCCTRYGNVMASRGSVIPLFVKQAREGRPITITDPDMTRFMMSLSDAVDLVLEAFINAKNGDIFIQKAPAVSIEILVRAILELIGSENHPIQTIGARHGEKLYEVLLSSEEMATARDLGRYYCIPSDGRDLNYSKYVDQGELKRSRAIHGHDFNSHNTKRFNCDEMKHLLMNLDFMKKIVLGDPGAIDRA